MAGSGSKRKRVGHFATGSSIWPVFFLLPVAVNRRLIFSELTAELRGRIDTGADSTVIWPWLYPDPLSSGPSRVISATHWPFQRYRSKIQPDEAEGGMMGMMGGAEEQKHLDDGSVKS